MLLHSHHQLMLYSVLLATPLQVLGMLLKGLSHMVTFFTVLFAKSFTLLALFYFIIKDIRKFSLFDFKLNYMFVAKGIFWRLSIIFTVGVSLSSLRKLATFTIFWINFFKLIDWQGLNQIVKICQFCNKVFISRIK